LLVVTDVVKVVLGVDVAVVDELFVVVDVNVVVADYTTNEVMLYN